LDDAAYGWLFLSPTSYAKREELKNSGVDPAGRWHPETAWLEEEASPLKRHMGPQLSTVPIRFGFDQPARVVVLIRESRESRIASPRKFSAKTTTKMARPGNRLIHQYWPYSTPVAIISPQLGAGGCAPRPRKLRPDSVISACEAVSDPKTTRLPVMFG